MQRLNHEFEVYLLLNEHSKIQAPALWQTLACLGATPDCRSLDSPQQASYLKQWPAVLTKKLTPLLSRVC